MLRGFRLRSSFPFLVDEAIYLRWAEIVASRQQFWVALLDGKQPLGSWIYAAVRAFTPLDPLLGARLISVVAGCGSTLLIYGIGRRLADSKVGLIAAGMYACFPYAILYDRVAYFESLVNLAGIACFYLSLRALRAPSPKRYRGCTRPRSWHWIPGEVDDPSIMVRPRRQWPYG